MSAKLFSFASQFFRRAEEISDLLFDAEEKEELKFQAQISFQTFIAEYLIDFLSLSTENSSRFYDHIIEKFNFLLDGASEYEEFFAQLKETIFEEVYKNMTHSDSFDFLEEILDGALNSNSFKKVEVNLQNYFAS